MGIDKVRNDKVEIDEVGRYRDKLLCTFIKSFSENFFGYSHLLIPCMQIVLLPGPTLS